MSASISSLPADARKGRDPLVDLLRGVFLVMMTVDHLDGVLSRVCFQAFGFVTAAEGFVVLSGYVSARVYGKMLERDPMRCARAIWRRVGLLYAAHAVLVVFVALTVWSRGTAPRLGDPYAPFMRAPLEYMARALSFRFQPYLLDVLPMYVLFVASLPLLLRGLRHSRLLVMAGSLGLWGISSVVGAAEWVEGSGLFVFPSWQVLFVGGALLAHLPDGAREAAARGRLAALGATVLVAFGLGWRYLDIATGARAAWLVARPDLGPFRLLTVLAYAILIVRYRVMLLSWLRVRWIEELGKHSLYVFVWHLPVVLWCKPTGFVRFLVANAGLAVQSGWVLVIDLAVTGLAVASLRVPALLHARWHTSPRIATA